jgi:uncharacterized protein YndB with AHSA1/START domain
MNMTETATRTVVVERKFAHPPEKVWRALTQGALIEEWLLKNDFQPVVGHQFKLRNEPRPSSRPSGLPTPGTRWGSRAWSPSR